MQWMRIKLRDLERNGVRIIQNWRRVVLAIIILIILVWVGYVWLVIGRWPDWTGFGTKTLWDLMQLLVIPAILAGGAYWLNESARKRERAATDQRTQETALQTYLDKMTELLLDKKLRESEAESEVRAVARVRTLTVLRRLNGDRKGKLLRFLYEADLIDKDKVVIYLAEADLSEANLSKANLSGAEYTKNAKDIRGTIWPVGFDPTAATGVICVNE